ncbi:aminotransferase class I/II-fold pyridoxal phosphate-dependent enzyme [Sulfitobacter mediterraneus]|uniref:trans-sulfuration enzyme family protein n=1 Tax=Sulfitobacter mediterraneus TaxID=83219 RepID=UPI0019392FE2|nr:aminotransferase class I/II-fold pyridoxal phosphate-dependent enzyme [Sulfitobacter mediterraneus]MBM1558601.1 aminotransferase class I/II-fold pyridoxal phosphate-dependent enzyme [Sulfitobacter mediterraneus]MBM1569960.1 aminotransferase class I/II-fold pyridoxal phosphate-dependent enzyme [Sulfitobacter mediterraneus]MBM1573921.1 aminotransferase class I/II-fold pyridoxal phosphate-dependent enzyme [Sulfitobacter mediterraneus]MBM1577752.1 aminotransferase class I/II-fold pyridoxal phosp
MTNPKILGDDASLPPALTKGGWLNDLNRARAAGPFLAAHPAPGTGLSTTAVHAGTHDDPRTGAVGTPIYQASTFVLNEGQYRSVEDGFARDRFIYSRYGNPSQWAVQEKLAALEGAESAIVFSSGMAAITSTVLALMDKGAHVVASSDLYGGTFNLFNQEFPTLGMSCTMVDPYDFDAIEAAIQPNTQMLYFEAITNPLLKVIDIPRLAEIAKRRNVRLVVDATFAPPVAMRTLDHGVDVVIHSASKYLNGHSDLIAGVAAGPRKLIDMIWPRLLNYGGSLDPHACFLLERGLKTLAVRMRAHEESALALAEFLESHPRVQKVFYPFLPSHPDYDTASRLLKNGTGNVTFFIEGGDQAALRLVDALNIPKQATSLGGVESLISLPFNTSQATFTAKQRADVGIDPGCVRLSVGIEDAADLIADFDQALTAIYPTKDTAHA